MSQPAAAAVSQSVSRESAAVVVVANNALTEMTPIDRYTLSHFYYYNSIQFDCFATILVRYPTDLCRLSIQLLLFVLHKIGLVAESNGAERD